MAKNTTAPQIPGGSPAASTVTSNQGDDNEYGTTGQDAGADHGSEEVTVPKSQLNELMAQIAALSSEVKTLKAAPAASAVAHRANPEADLPHQDEIDVTTLKSPVLTKQGWLVPETFGANPNANKAL